MAAPAFMPYTAHDPLITDQYGTYCPGCRDSVSANTTIKVVPA
jgi:hypothetical protein